MITTQTAAKKVRPEPVYSILVKNISGASDGMVGTKSEINSWLKTWSDPEDLTADITDAAGHAVATKPSGRKTICWKPS